MTKIDIATVFLVMMLFPGCEERSVLEPQKSSKASLRSEYLSDEEFRQRQAQRIENGEPPRVTRQADLVADDYYRSLQEAVDRLFDKRTYNSDELEICTATVEHTVFAADPAHEIAKAAWEAKWQKELIQYEVCGGCGCCVEKYMIEGPRAAILEYPMHPSLLEHYPRWHTAPKPQ